MAVQLSSYYVEMPPPPALAELVACVWEHRVAPGVPPLPQPVLPDGCADIVLADGVALVAGPATRTVLVPQRPGSITSGVRFRPGAAPAGLGLAACELLDLTVSLADVWGRADAEAAVDGGMEAVVAALTRRREQRGALDDEALAVAELLAADPSLAVTELADEVGLSERQLRRRVEVAVGYGPRTLGRVLRFQSFLAAARALPADRRDLAQLAAECGYADQAHLTRESRALAGSPPARLLAAEAARLAA